MAGKLPQLQSPRQEVEEIAKFFNVRPVVGRDATRKSVVTRMSNCRIIHFATHARLAEKQSEDEYIPGALVLGVDDDGMLILIVLCNNNYETNEAISSTTRWRHFAQRLFSGH